MLTHPTLDLLHELGLHGMDKGYKAPEQAAETVEMTGDTVTVLVVNGLPNHDAAGALSLRNRGSRPQRPCRGLRVLWQSQLCDPDPLLGRAIAPSVERARYS
jgi:hypothetical protein